MKSYMNFIYTIKIHNHRFNDKNVEKVSVETTGILNMCKNAPDNDYR